MGHAKDYYNTHEWKYRRIDKIRIKQMNYLINKHLKIDSMLLDIGCGNGSLTKSFVKTHAVYGLDNSSVCVNKSICNGIQAIQSDLKNEFPFGNHVFDIIVAGEIIEHMEDTDFFIKEIKRVMKPDGILILSTPNLASLPRRIKLLLGINPSMEASYNYPAQPAGHLRYFTYKLLKGFMEFHRLKITDYFSNFIPRTLGTNIVLGLQNET